MCQRRHRPIVPSPAALVLVCLLLCCINSHVALGGNASSSINQPPPEGDRHDHNIAEGYSDVGSDISTPASSFYFADKKQLEDGEDEVRSDDQHPQNHITSSSEAIKAFTEKMKNDPSNVVHHLIIGANKLVGVADGAEVVLVVKPASLGGSKWLFMRQSHQKAGFIHRHTDASTSFKVPINYLEWKSDVFHLVEQTSAFESDFALVTGYYNGEPINASGFYRSYFDLLPVLTFPLDGEQLAGGNICYTSDLRDDEVRLDGALLKFHNVKSAHYEDLGSLGGQLTFEFETLDLTPSCYAGLKPTEAKLPEGVKKCPKRSPSGE